MKLSRLLTQMFRSPASSHPEAYLRPRRVLELGGSRDGDMYLAAYEAEDTRCYFLTLPRPADGLARISVDGEQASKHISVDQCHAIGRELARLLRTGEQRLNAYEQECLIVLSSYVPDMHAASPQLTTSDGQSSQISSR